MKIGEKLKRLVPRRPLTADERAGRVEAEIERQQIRADRERIGDEQTGKTPPLSPW